jgi:hypothetical protein
MGERAVLVLREARGLVPGLSESKMQEWDLKAGCWASEPLPRPGSSRGRFEVPLL